MLRIILLRLFNNFIYKTLYYINLSILVLHLQLVLLLHLSTLILSNLLIDLCTKLLTAQIISTVAIGNAICNIKIIINMQ